MNAFPGLPSYPRGAVDQDHLQDWVVCGHTKWASEALHQQALLIHQVHQGTSEGAFFRPAPLQAGAAISDSNSWQAGR